jgi:nucleoid DNA-binding protein
MNRTQTIAIVSRRLRHLTRHDVSEVYKLIIDTWRAALLQPGGYVDIPGLGKLYIEAQDMRCAGAILTHLQAKRHIAPTTLRRYYCRFRPAGVLRQALLNRDEANEAPS